MIFETKHKEYLAACDKALNAAVDTLLPQGSVVSEAAAYSLMNSGKRVRGVLTLAVSDMLHGNEATAAQFAAAVEMIHTFSLIHDDLPCMDDDDMRRGKPACHIVYGEANALLAGDLLSILAFETLATAPCEAQRQADAVRLLAALAGAKGMIYGQELDMRFETELPTEADLHNIHKYKTGALIQAAAQLGMVAAGVQPDESTPVGLYAKNIGLVFQIVDDILDVTADPQQLGKPVGSDAKSGKTTFVSMHGLEAAKAQATRLTQEAVDTLAATYGGDAWFLTQFAQNLASRIY